MPRTLRPDIAITGYFSLVILLGIASSLAGGGFGLTALTNAAMAFGVFSFLSLSLLTLLIGETRRTPMIHRSVLPQVTLLCYMILVGFLIGAAAGNTRLYLFSTTLYWLNTLLFVFYVSTLDCTRLNLLRFGKAVIVITYLLTAAGIGVDSELMIFLACILIIFLLGERNTIWFLACLGIFVIKLGGLNRGFMLGIFICLFVGAVIYRRSFILIALLALTTALFFTFTTIDPAQISAPGTPLYRRLTELQILLSGSQPLEELTALQQRLFEIQLVNQVMDEASLIGRVLGAGFGRTLDMSASADSSVLSAATTGATHVHNVHSLYHSVYLRSGYLGVAYLALVFLGMLTNVVRTIFVPVVSPLLAFCVLFPLLVFFSALPAANYFLTSFMLLALLALANILIQQQKQEQELPEHGPPSRPRLSGRRKIVWRG